MKSLVKTIVLLSIIILFCVKSLGLDIPGGIVYSDGKDAIFYDLTKGQKSNITADVPQIQVSGPFSASENGDLLTWIQNGKFICRNLKNGKVFTVTASRYSIVQSGGKLKSTTDQAIDTIAVNGTRSVFLSPDGLKIAYEFTGVDIALPQNSNTTPKLEFGTCSAVNILRTDWNNILPAPFFNPAEEGLSDIGTCRNGMFGNVAFYATKFPLEISNINGKKISKINFDQPPPIFTYRYKSGDSVSIYPTLQDALRKFTQKRDACFPTFSRLQEWESGEKNLALTYQNQDGFFSSIDIYDYNWPKLEQEKKPGFYEIVLANKLRSCRGLSWTPGGSLCILSDDKVGIISRERIQALKQSAVIFNKDVSVNTANARLGYPTKQAPRTVAVNNIAQVAPELLTSGVLANNIVWITERSFLCLGVDGFVYLWENGKTEKLIQIPSGRFSYCKGLSYKQEKPIVTIAKSNESLSSQQSTESRLDPDFKPTTRKDIYASGVVQKKRTELWKTGRILENLEAWARHPFYLVFYWDKIKDENRSIAGIIVNWRDEKNKEEILYAIVDKTTFDSTSNPSIYEYKSSDTPVKVPLNTNKVLVFKQKNGNAYAALRPAKMGARQTIDFETSVWWRFGYTFNQTIAQR